LKIKRLVIGLSLIGALLLVGLIIGLSVGLGVKSNSPSSSSTRFSTLSPNNPSNF
jgi:hypothetical protein